MLLRLFLLLAIVGAGTIWVPAFAHQQKAAIIQVLFNERSGSLEVAHRFYLHDAEEAVRQLYGADADIHNKSETKLKFAQLIVSSFGLWGADDKTIPLELLGYEIDGGFFWVYQEAQGSLQHPRLTVRHGALRNLWSDQVNTVNVEGKGPLQTLIFDGMEPVQFVTFD
jgi:hypothetical protein